MIKVKETVCTEIKYNTSTNTEYDPDPPAPYCSHREQNEVFLNHFDLVSVTFLSNPSFLDICEYENCSNLSFIASAGYIDYLIEKRSTKFTLDIFSRTLQVLSLAFGVAELLVAIRTSNFIRGVVGDYTVVGDAFALTIDSPAFYEYLQSAYPNDWQDYKETISMVSIIHGITATGANIGYSIYTVSQANRFIGEVEALQWNPAVMERMTASEVNLLQKTREKLIAELYALRKNLHTNQIIEEEIRFWRDYRNLGIPNAVRGNTQEWNLAKQTILDYRSIPVNNKGNYGYLEGSINGISLDTVIDPLSNNKIFGTAPLAVAEAEPQVFTALEVNWSRITDSEYRMLNKLALTLEPNARHVDVAIDVFPNYTGTIKIISERAYCTSCQGAIKQFNRMFPNVNIILIDAVKL